MPRIVDLTLPVTSNMSGIPKIAFYDQYPTKVQAVTVVNEEQRETLAAKGVDLLPQAPAINSMNTVFTLNTHIGTHIDAPRHFYADGASISDIPLDRIVMREALILDVSHKSAGDGVTATDLEQTGIKPGPGRLLLSRPHGRIALSAGRSSGTIRFISSRALANGSNGKVCRPSRWTAFQKNHSG